MTSPSAQLDLHRIRFHRQYREGLRQGRRCSLDGWLEQFPPEAAAAIREEWQHIHELPEQLGPYRVLELIDRGGMGLVYRARDARSGDVVALKLVPRNAKQDPRRIQRLRREAEVGRRFDHDNILRVRELVEAEGETLLAMDLVAGRTLAALWAERAATNSPFDLRSLLRIALGIAHGLEALHAAGFVHRDIKPDNVMVDDGGRVRIVDLGLVRSFGEKSAIESEPSVRPTRTGEVLGSEGYMCREQRAGGAPDPRWDVYALGVTLCELITLEPFRRGVDASDEFNRGLQRLGGAAEELRRIVIKCLLDEPSSRWASAKEVREALEALLSRATREMWRTNRLLRDPFVWAILAVCAISAGSGGVDLRYSHAMQLALSSVLFVRARRVRDSVGRGLEVHEFWSWVFATFAVLYLVKLVGVVYGLERTTWYWSLDALFSNLNAGCFYLVYLTLDTHTRKDANGQRPRAFRRAAVLLGAAVAGLTVLGVSTMGGPESSLFATVPGALFMGLGLCLVAGRLDSKILWTPRWFVLLIYIYALIQLAYVLFPVLGAGSDTVQWAALREIALWTLPVLYAYSMVGKWVLQRTIERLTVSGGFDLYEDELRKRLG